MTGRFRFAPSPTGYLHVGNARLALINWLMARKSGGEMILRLDDTDSDRSTPEFADAIEADLLWLGLDWSELRRQSERSDAYVRAFEALKAAGRIYPCYETAEELEYRRKRQLARKQPPIYDRAALALSEEERSTLEAEGRKPHWRFLLDQGVIRWRDLVRGEVEVDAASMSDPVLIRSDGRPLYHLPSVVDDIDFGITHIIRGEDHVSNTALHIQIFAALKAPAPTFGHIPLLTGPDGGPLSKREGSASLREMRESGIEPMALACLLARLGTSENVELRASLHEIAEHFDISQFSRAAARFDPAELAHLNTRLLHRMEWADVRARLDLDGATEAFWLAVRGNLATLDEARGWWQVVTGPITPVIEPESESLRAAAARLLPQGALDPSSWKAWTDAIKAETGAKGKALFLPLRLALTGRDHGPEMNNLLPLIGRAHILARLNGRTA